MHKILCELQKGKALKEVKLVDKMLKYKQIGVCLAQDKLKLLVLKQKYDSFFVGHRKGKKTTIECCKGVQMR
jgi:hypothetical protein